MVLSFGERLDLISPGEWSDGLQRQGSNPWSTTTQEQLHWNTETLDIVDKDQGPARKKGYVRVQFLT